MLQRNYEQTNDSRAGMRAPKKRAGVTTTDAVRESTSDMCPNDLSGQKPPAKRPNTSESVTLTDSDTRQSAYTDAELNRIEETLGRRARRRARALTDLRQMHLTEFTSDDHAQPATTPTPAEATA